MRLPGGAALRAAAIATDTYRFARSVQRHVLDRSELHDFGEHVATYRRLLPSGALCYDVGANVGRVAEALLEAGMHVVAFEPQARCAREIAARCSGYPDLAIIQAALGATPSVATLYVRQSHGQSGLLADWQGETVGTVDVPVLTLDVAIEKYGDPYFAKIDVEGYEPQVLQGLSRPIPLVSLEYHLSDTEIAKTLSCASRLWQLGVRWFNFTPGERPGLALEEWLPLDGFGEWFPAKPLGANEAFYGDLFFARDRPS